MLITVVDNFLNDTGAEDVVEKSFVDFKSWHFMERTSEKGYESRNTVDAGQISCMVMEDGKFVEPSFPDGKLIIDNLIDVATGYLKQIGFTHYAIQRIKYNVTFPAIGADNDTHGIAHHDVPPYQFDENSKEIALTVLYYANESDGDTVFFNRFMQETRRIAPKRGSAVIFDASTFHAGAHPLTYDTRKVINMVFYVKRD